MSCRHERHCGHRHERQRHGRGPSGYPPQVGNGGNYAYAGPPPYGAVQPSYPATTYAQDGGLEAVNHLYAQEQRHKRNEHIAEGVALGAAGFAIYEHHQVKVDPEHAGRHRNEEHIAEAVALGAGGYALYEDQQVRHDRKLLAEAGYPHQRGHHGHHKEHHHGLLN